MQDEFLKLMLQGGAAGAAVMVLWPMVKKYMDRADRQVDARLKDMAERLALAEKRLDNCEEDRAKLHQDFADLLLRISSLPG